MTLKNIFLEFPLISKILHRKSRFQQENEDISNLVGITYLGTINEYLGLTMKFIIAFGLCFQLPVLLTLMGKAGLVSSEVLAKSRKYARPLLCCAI